MENLFEKKLCGETKFEGKIVRIERDEIILPNGNSAFREVVRKNGGVCVVPLTSEDEVVFVEQFRYPYGKVIAEIPAGKLEDGEEPLTCAIRELSEETGCEAGKMIYLGEFYPSPGIMDEVLYMYLALDLKYGEIHTDPDEFLTNKKIPLAKAVEMITCGEIKDGKTQAAVLKTAILKQKGEF